MRATLADRDRIQSDDHVIIFLSTFNDGRQAFVFGVNPLGVQMDGTVNPDFSQVESDAGQFQFDPRQVLFFPEKRPFFLDGIEQFATPNNLIYTRRVAAPVAAAKLTGKVSGRTNLAYLTAIDDPSLSATGDTNPVFNILRLQRDLFTSSRAAFVYTDRIDGPRSNRVVGADARLVWRDIYSLSLQAALSRTVGTGPAATAPLWQGVFARTGRRFGVRYSARGVDPDFRAAAGFISRTGIAVLNASHQLTTYGRPGAALERWTSDVVVDGTWQYDELAAGRSSQDRKLHFNNNFTFRGGWRVGGSVLVESFGYDEALYTGYRLGEPTPEGVVFHPFVGEPRLPNLDFVVSASTPPRRGAELDLFWISRDACAATGCSSTSPRRARCSSPGTGAPLSTRRIRGSAAWRARPTGSS